METRPPQKYNQAYTLNFSLFEIDGVDLRIDATFATGDIVIMKDEGAEANTTNLPTDEGTGYSLVLTATEMSAARIVLYLIDQTATKVWLDIAIGIETYGNASAQHEFDLDTAQETLAAIADAIWDEAKSGHTTQDTFGESFNGIVAGTAITGTLSTTQFTSDLTETTDDHYLDRTVVFITGVLAGQSSEITAYAGSNKLFTVNAMTDAPANNDRFVVI